MTPDKIVNLLIPVRSLVKGSDEVYLELRQGPDGDHWAFTLRGLVCDENGNWEYEPMPSSRTDEFIARTRFTFEQAIELLGRMQALKKHPFVSGKQEERG